MLSFVPNKRHLWELLIYFFNLKKSVAEAYRLLGEAALGERNYREWFQKFKKAEFDIEDKEHSGRPKVYEHAELEALLDRDLCQTNEKILRMKHKVLFFNNKCPIFDKKRRKLIKTYVSRFLY